ncbi:MAG: hypothetical protein KJ630_05405 [Proteobacteria bacterium]|nr:hypothetical protein [Pseudomonadota bacterium]
MSEKKSYSELFHAGIDPMASPGSASIEDSPGIKKQQKIDQNSGLDATIQAKEERPRHTAIIPGYEKDRIKERKILTLRDLLYIFFKHLQSITIVTVVCFVAAGAYSLIATPLYKSDTKILVRLGREKLSDLSEYSRNVSVLYQERNQDVNNELEVFKGDELSRMVYEDLKAHFEQTEKVIGNSGGRLSTFFARISAILTGSKLSREDEIILFLKDSLQVEFLAETDILRLTFSSPDPEFAATAANAYANAFVRLRTTIYEKKNSYNFYLEQMALSQQKVDDLVAEQTAFSRKWQISEIEKEKELILQHRENLEAESLRVQQDYNQTIALLAGIKKMYDTPGDWIETPKMSENEMVDRQGYLQDVDRQYFTLKLERSRLSSQFTEKSREIQQIDSSIAQLRKQKYLSLMNILELARTAREPIVKGLASEIERKNKRINDLIQATFIDQNFKANKALALDILANYTKKAEDLRIYDDLDKKRITSLSTINTAITPLQPYFPQKQLILLTATFFGVFLSFGLSAVKEFFTHVFRDGQDIESILKTPLLMSIGYREKS